MVNDDERDFAEEDANRQDMEREMRTENCIWCHGDQTTIELVGHLRGDAVQEEVERICTCEDFCHAGWCKHFPTND